MLQMSSQPTIRSLFMRTPAPSLSGASPPHRCANHERAESAGDAMRERPRAASSRHDTSGVAARLGIGTAGYGAFPAGVRLHSNHSFTGAGHHRRRNAARNAGFPATVSGRALISRFPIARSRAQDGAMPER